MQKRRVNFSRKQTMSLSDAWSRALCVAARGAPSYKALCVQLATLPSCAARRRPEAAAVKLLDEMLDSVSFDAHVRLVACTRQLGTYQHGYDCRAADGLPYDIVALLTKLVNECSVRGRRVPRSMRLSATRDQGYILLKWHVAA